LVQRYKDEIADLREEKERIESEINIRLGYLEEEMRERSVTNE
jgi:hypothetical protein